jgi:hypothetical protein
LEGCTGNCSTCGGGSSEIIIDYLYLDNDTCDRCKETEESLDEAVAEMSRILYMAGTQIFVNKIHVDTIEKATEYRLTTSPTIRVNGKDIQENFNETTCKCCGEICNDDVFCREWTYMGETCDYAPKKMIVDAVLKAIYMPSCEPWEEEFELPENIRKFFEGKNKKIK